MQTLATTETQPHALGMQAALDWLSDLSTAARKPVCPFPIGSRQWDDWYECFHREQSDFLAAVHNL